MNHSEIVSVLWGVADLIRDTFKRGKYLAVVLDLASRRVVGWVRRGTLEAALATDALTMALGSRKPAGALLHHSDRGVQPGFNWSSQKRSYKPNVETRPVPRRVFSSRVFHTLLRGAAPGGALLAARAKLSACFPSGYPSTKRGQLQPLWQQAVQAAAGPLITVGITLLCCFYAVRRGPHVLVIATGMVAPVRFLIGVVYLGYAALVWLRGGRMGGSDIDEYNVARASGIPLAVLLGVDLLFLMAAWAFLATRVDRAERGTALPSVAVGMVLGLLLWLRCAGSAATSLRRRRPHAGRPSNHSR